MTVLIPEIMCRIWNFGLAFIAVQHRCRQKMISMLSPLNWWIALDCPAGSRTLLAVVRLKQLCREAGVERIDAGPKGAVLTFRKNSFARPENLLAYIAKNAPKQNSAPITGWC